MGTLWESTLVECAADEIPAIANEATILLPLVFKNRLSINAFSPSARPGFWSLECAGFRQGPVNLTGELEVFQAPRQLSKYGRSADLALAYIASKIVGSATWVYMSTSVGEAATASFRAGALENFVVANDSAYEKVALTAFRALPDINFFDDDVVSTFYGETSHSLSFCVDA